MNQSNYNETLIDVLFDKIIQAGDLEVTLLVSLMKTCKKGRYNDPKAIQFLFDQAMHHIRQGNLLQDF